MATFGILGHLRAVLAPFHAPMGVLETVSDRAGLIVPMPGLCLTDPQTPPLNGGKGYS